MPTSTNKPINDLIQELIEDCLMAFPVSSFLIGIYKQHQQRGFLTKKQMQGLHTKASEVATINSGKLATLQAIINKMPNRYKSEIPKIIQPVFQKDEAIGGLLQAILDKYPQHKRVLFLKARYDNNELLSVAEVTEVKKFHKMLK